MRAFRKGSVVATLLISSLLMGCSEAEIDGQVVARVDSLDITVRELDHEMIVGAHASRQAALEAIVDRKILVQEAQSRRLDLDDEFHFAQRRASEVLLVEALSRELSKSSERIDDDQAWIMINEQPWRFKDRTRLYLTRGDGDAGKTLFWVDSADYESDPPIAILNAQPGDVLSLNDQDWEVHVREAQILPPEDMLRAALAELAQQQQDTDLGMIIEAYRQTGRTVYQSGFGPAQAGAKTESVAGDAP